jgi:CHASE2 domain-containing sensor protein
VHARKEQKAALSSFKALLWTAIAGLVFGLIGFGEIAEDLIRAGRNSLHWHKASGEIVLVKIDDASIREMGAWPWTRTQHANMLDALTKAGAKRVFFNVPMYGPTQPADDDRLVDSIKRSGRAVLAVKTRSGPNSGAQQYSVPYAPLAKNARLGSITAKYNYQNAVWRIPYAVPSASQPLPSFATMLANRRGPVDETFMVDY